MKRVARTGEFNVRTEEGDVVRVIQYQTYLRVRSPSGGGEIEDVCELRTADGEHVNAVSEKEYEILGVWGSKKAARV